MNPLDFALYSFLVLAALVFYKIITMRMALAARGRMVQTVREILANPDVPHELKHFALGAFHLSANSWFLPGLLWFSFTKLPNKSKDEIARAKKFTSDNAKVLDAIIRQHLFRINVLAAPHWYVVSLLLFTVSLIAIGLLTLGLRSGEKIYAGVERLILTPEEFVLKRGPLGVSKDGPITAGHC
jgi:hypothetical protein